jgi:hypothetical protein
VPDIVKPAYRYLMASGVPATLITDGLLGADPTYPTGWVFSGEQQGLPFREVENTGKCAIVLYSYDTWATPSMYQQNVAFPRLRLAIYADTERDAEGNYTKHDGDDRARAVWDRVWPLFHDARNIVRKFDTLHIVSTLLEGGPDLMPIPGGDNAHRLTASFRVQT